MSQPTSETSPTPLIAVSQPVAGQRALAPVTGDGQLPAPYNWNFYLPDEDRNSGWSNHTYVLQHVCSGTGPTPELAWQDALADDNVPRSYELDDPPTIAIRDDREQAVHLPAQSS